MAPIRIALSIKKYLTSAARKRQERFVYSKAKSLKMSLLPRYLQADIRRLAPLHTKRIKSLLPGSPFLDSRLYIILQTQKILQNCNTNSFTHLASNHLKNHSGEFDLLSHWLTERGEKSIVFMGLSKGYAMTSSYREIPVKELELSRVDCIWNS